MLSEFTLSASAITSLLVIRAEVQKHWQAVQNKHNVAYATTQAAKILNIGLEKAIPYPDYFSKSGLPQTTKNKRALRLQILANIVGFSVASAKDLPASVISAILDVKHAGSTGGAAYTSMVYHEIVTWAYWVRERVQGPPTNEAIKQATIQALSQEYPHLWPSEKSMV